MNDSIPTYRLHKASGQAVVTLSHRTFYLGKHNSPESRTAYDRKIAEWLAHGRRPFWKPNEGLTVSDVFDRFDDLVLTGYTDHRGAPSSEVRVYRAAVSELLRLYGDTLASEFDQTMARTLLHELARSGKSQATVGHYFRRIRRVFRWAASEGFVTPTTSDRLRLIDVARTANAKKTESVRAVEAWAVDATLEQLDPVTADMVRFQRLTGARPGEVCSISWGQIDQSRPVWRYELAHHKTEHRGKTRTVLIGPKAQAILERHRTRAVGDRLISTDGISASRPIFLSERGAAPTVNQYRANVGAACARAGVDRWTPNQLRHAAATEIRQAFGLEATSAVLGHSRVETSQVYAERTLVDAERVASEVG